MARPTKDREIQVQKPAQSLAHFQTKLGQGAEEDGGLLKPILMGVAGIVVGGLAYGAFATWRGRAIEKHEAALSALIAEVEGDGVIPPAPAEVEKRMRERLGRLEALVAAAPGSRRDATAGLLATWRLTLDGKAPAAPAATDPWGRIRLAQRSLALGQAAEAKAQLDPLRAKATPDEPWSEAFWASRIEVARLAGDRAQALKDLADYKAAFKGRGDTAALESLLQGI